jgi:hypothetical protein
MSIDPDDPTTVLESWTPIVKGNPLTGQIVWDNDNFDANYKGPDFRQVVNKPLLPEWLGEF